MSYESRRKDWSELDHEGDEPDIHAEGVKYFDSMLSLWETIKDAYGEEKIQYEIAERLAQHFSCLFADYIESFPAKVQVEVARNLFYGILCEEMSYDTDVYEDSRRNKVP